MADQLTLLTIAEVAEELRSSETNVYRLIHSGQMPHTLIGKRRYVVSRGQLDAYILASAVDPDDLEARANAMRAAQQRAAAAG